MGWGAAKATGLGFVLLLSTLVCCQPTELILVGFINFQFYPCRSASEEATAAWCALQSWGHLGWRNGVRGQGQLLDAYFQDTFDDVAFELLFIESAILFFFFMITACLFCCLGLVFFCCLSILVCCQPTELIQGFFCVINFPILLPPPPLDLVKQLKF